MIRKNMKKLVLTLFVLILVKTSFAQTFNPGLRFNPVFSWMRAESDDPNVTMSSGGLGLGFSVGLMGDYFIKDNYGISVEARITQLTAKFSYATSHIDFPGADPAQDNTLSLQYVELPISLKMKTNEIGYTKYYGQAGIIPALNTRARADRKITNSNYNAGQKEKAMLVLGQAKDPEENVNVKSEISAFDMFVMIGGGMEYTLSGTTALLGGISYQHGLMNVNDNANKKYNLKNRYISLNLGIVF